MVQHCVEEIGQPDHLRLASTSAKLRTKFVNSHVLSSIFFTLKSQITPIFVRPVGGK